MNQYLVQAIVVALVVLASIAFVVTFPVDTLVPRWWNPDDGMFAKHWTLGFANAMRLWGLILFGLLILGFAILS